MVKLKKNVGFKREEYNWETNEAKKKKLVVEI